MKLFRKTVTDRALSHWQRNNRKNRKVRIWRKSLHLGKLHEFGTVTIGKRADLILVEENPLEDVLNLSKRAGVMLHGIWFPEAQLANMLKELAD